MKEAIALYSAGGTMTWRKDDMSNLRVETMEEADRWWRNQLEDSREGPNPYPLATLCEHHPSGIEAPNQDDGQDTGPTLGAMNQYGSEGPSPKAETKEVKLENPYERGTREADKRWPNPFSLEAEKQANAEKAAKIKKEPEEGQESQAGRASADRPVRQGAHAGGRRSKESGENQTRRTKRDKENKEGGSTREEEGKAGQRERGREEDPEEGGRTYQKGR